MSYRNNLFFLVLVFLVFQSCKDEVPENQDIENIVSRLDISPKGLNPTMNLSASANNIYPLLYLPIAGYNPETLKFEPTLIDELPTAIKITDGKYAGGVEFNMRIKDEAKWDDGKDITAKDYLFTIKSINHPKTNSIRYRAYIDNLAEVVLNPDDRKELTVRFKKLNIAATELATTIPILPQHIYDPSFAMDLIDMEDLKDEKAYQIKAKANPGIDSFAIVFNSPKHTREVVVGNGRYRLKEWLSDQYIRLERKENHWIENGKSALTDAYPKEITFLLTPDNAAALAQLKADQFDIYNGLSAQEVEDLKSNESYNEKFDFYQIKLARYYYININSRKEKLADKRVRKALAYLMDVDTIISSYEKGLGERINSQFLTVDELSTLEDIKFNRKKADELLADAGWVDTNDNGILDKSINGELTELEVDFVGTGSPLGQLISGVYKQMAAPSGIKINVVNLDRTKYKQQMSNLDFDLSVGGKGQSLAPYDPYAMLHTDNVDPGEGNLSNFGNAESDALIETIRTTTDPKVRDQAYLDLEKIMNDEQSIIFLYSPMANIAVKKGLKGVISQKKPGFAVNTFRKK